jgi:hypothetical protein
MGVKTWLEAWPVDRQLTGADPLSRGAAVRSGATANLQPRTSTADRVDPRYVVEPQRARLEQRAANGASHASQPR